MICWVDSAADSPSRIATRSDEAVNCDSSRCIYHAVECTLVRGVAEIPQADIGTYEASNEPSPLHALRGRCACGGLRGIHRWPEGNRGRRRPHSGYGSHAKAHQSNRRQLRSPEQFSGELEFLRKAMLGGTPNFGPENPARREPRRDSRCLRGRGPAVCSSPDAAESDTEVIETTDAELVEQENLEAIRGQGFEAEPIENPPGIVKNV